MSSAWSALAATSLVRAASRRSGCFWRASTASTASLLPRLRYYSSSPREPLVVVSDLPAPNSGHIRVLELNRPDARNAISLSLLEALRGQVEAVAQQYDSEGNELPVASTAGQNGLGPTRALILASAVDSCFCAGADLKERRAFTQDETNAFLDDLRGTFSALSALPIPTIAAVSSVALGGGLELALSTHMRVFSSNAFVGLPETRLGIIPGAGGTYRLPMLIGVGRARDLILTGRRVSAPEAYFLGIADRLVEVAEDVVDGEGERDEQEIQQKVLETARRAALSEAVRLAEEICSGGPVAVRAALKAVHYPTESVENAMYDKVVATHDRNEALRAFAEKRRPAFQGR